MSGFCGICQPAKKIEQGTVDAMLAALTVPGDGIGQRFGSDHLRFGIVSRWEFQTQASIPGISLAADADLCDLNRLRVTLADKGIESSHMSLGELLAWAYVAFGVSFVERLQGGFSFALWDNESQRLVLGVDRFGIKPLFWGQSEGQLVFGSRASAVAAGLGKAPEVNLTALMQFLVFSVVPAPLSIYRGIERMAPGFLLIYGHGRVSQQCYSDFRYTEERGHSLKYWATEIRDSIRDSVHRHMGGLNPVTTGAYLSGGTDSSTVVACMSERQSPVPAFSISFGEQQYNELGFARLTAKQFRAVHHVRQVQAKDALNAIPKLIEYYDEPFANSSAIGGYYCALLAREHGIDTMLAGDGGDELFGGNERYATDKYFALYHRIPRWIRRSLIEPVVRRLPQGDGWLTLPRRYVNRATLPNPLRIFSYNFFLSIPPEDIFTDDFLSAVPPESWMSTATTHFQRAAAESELNCLLYLDMKMTLADNDLRKVSGTAELAGVRVRYPFLDSRLTDLTSRMPAQLKVRGFEKRFAFKEALKNTLPKEILYKTKHGFGVPLGLWLLQDSGLNSLLHDVFTDSQTRQRGYFRPSFLDKLPELHSRDHTAYYGEVVWYLLSLELWHRRHLKCASEVALGC